MKKVILKKAMLNDMAKRLANFEQSEILKQQNNSEYKRIKYTIRELVVNICGVTGLTNSQLNKVFTAYKKELYSRY